MPAWLLPAVKLILPHVSNIVAAAKPVFTKLKKEDLPDNVGQQQIAELQTAASENATHIKELAEQLRLTVGVLEQGAADAEKRMRSAYAIAVTAVLFSLAALGIAAYAVLLR